MSNHRPTRIVRPAVIGLVAAALVALTLPATSATAASNPVDSRFFGVHHAPAGEPGAIGWPKAPVGSVRLWDSGVTWRDIEKTNNHFDFSRLDAAVKRARANRSDVLLVLGMTPRFHAVHPSSAGMYGAGTNSMPAYSAWRRYVRAVARRNVSTWGRTVTFQVWNEANVRGFWGGTQQEMATLTRWTREALRSVDSRSRLVAPAFVTRLASQRAWMDTFWGKRTGGRAVASYVDVVSLQLYPLSGGPEGSMALLSTARQILARHNVRKPIYNTEINYGLIGGARAGARAANVTRSTERGYVARTYLLNAQRLVSRVYWYGWTSHGLVNTEMTTSNNITLTSPGARFGVVRSWILGTRPKGCTVSAGTYVCRFTSSRGVLRAVWNPSRTVTYTVPAGSTSYRTLANVTHATKRGAHLRVGREPILVRSSR